VVAPQPIGLFVEIKKFIPSFVSVLDFQNNKMCIANNTGQECQMPDAALPTAAETVRAFLAAMEERDLPAAKGFLGDGFVMTFPGGVVMHTLPDLIDWARPRYRFVRKAYDGFDDAGEVVYCFGTLSGEWPDGTAFSGIRFIDRFELSGCKITRQDVWNDVAEVRP
jgi:hypothetical protein